jgi:zinc transporter 2
MNEANNEEKALLIMEQKDDEKLSQYKDQLKETNNKVIKKLIKVSFYCTIFMAIEFVGGWLSNSLAIMTDAAHLLSDLSGFIISIASLYIALRPANLRLTYGYHRAEVLGALGSILIIWILTIWLAIEAVDRFYNPEKIDGLVMISIASCGLVFNLIMSKILMSEDLPHGFHGHDHSHDHSHSHGHSHNHELSHEQIHNHHNHGHCTHNHHEHKDDGKIIIGISNSPPILDHTDNPVLRAAFVHILGDILQSIGVLIASLLIYTHEEDNPAIVIIDPICTFFFAIIVLSTSIPVSKDCLSVLMEAAPSNIDIYSLMKEITLVNGVVNVHDLHVWCISIGKPAISLHMLSDNPQNSLEDATQLCQKYGIFHSTIQVEDNTHRRRGSFVQCTHSYDNTIH